MVPVSFPEANKTFGPPEGYTKDQVVPVRAYVGEHKSGSVDGAPVCVVCWQLSIDEIEFLKANDGKLFISMIGGLAAHYPALTFHQATHPA